MDCFADAAKRIGWLLLFGAGVCWLSTSFAPQAAATGSQVEARLCNPAQATSSLTITAPKSDSVISQLPLELTGETTNVSQFDVSVDGSYMTTQAIASGQNDFTTSVQLASGTHTLQFVGNSICGSSQPSDSIVVTYQPESTPGNGDQTPTTVGPTPTTVNRQSSGVAAINSNSPPFVQSVRRAAHALAYQLDFDDSSTTGTSADMFRAVILLLGIIVAIFCAPLSRRLNRRFAGWPVLLIAGILAIAVAILF